MNLEDIIEALPKLNPAELEQVRLRIQALSALDGVQPGQDDWLLKGIIRQMDDAALADTVPRNFKINNRRQHHGYADKAEKVRSTFQAAVPDLTRTEMSALGYLLARCLSQYISEFREPSFQAMLHHVDMVPAAFSKAFPDYLGNRTVAVVLRGLVGLRKPRTAG